MISPLISPARLARWVSTLVQIPSVTPNQAGPSAGPPGEGIIAAQLADWFTDFGGQVQQEEVHPNRPNVYAIWPGSSDRWLAVDVHTDTVGVEQMSGDPFDGRIADGRVYGRGSVDTKATLGVILALLEAMQEQGRQPRANLLIAATADEETGAQAAPIFARWLERESIPLDQLVIAEPTMCRPVYGHKGGLRYEFSITGQSAHAAKPERGKNAVAAAAHLILALEAEHRRLGEVPPITDLGPSTLAVTGIQGGTGSNIIPNACRVQASLRWGPGPSAEEIDSRIKTVARKGCPLPVEVSLITRYDWFYQSPDTAWIQQLAEWAGGEPTTVPFGTNAWAHTGRPYETVVLGPGSIDQAHGKEEWVDISQLETLARIYQRWWGLVD